MPQGIYQSTKSTAAQRRRTSSIVQNDSNTVSQYNTHLMEIYCLEFNSLTETIKKRIHTQWKAFEIEFTDMRKKVRELEKEVLDLKEVLLWSLTNSHRKEINW